MATHLQREVEQLKDRLLALTATVEDKVRKAVKAVSSRNPVLAREVIASDAAIDRSEVGVEEECLKLLALYQPVATDLRFIIAVLKVNSDIERVGDLAVNIAERALFLCTQPPIEAPFDLAGIETKAVAMLRQSLDALINLDAPLARAIRQRDDEVDAINREMYGKVAAAIRRNPELVELLLSHLSVSRHLERIADYATNIAENVVYLAEGQIVRHKPSVP